VRKGWLAALAIIVGCGGRLSEPGEDSGSPSPQGPTTGSPHDGGSTPEPPTGTPAPGSPPDASFEVCPLEPPQIGTPCDLAANTGCAYFGFQNQCESFICVDRAWKSANGDGC
jgi:hypothetical protein